MRARANAVRALALNSADRCIQSTALSRSLPGGSGACRAICGVAHPSATTRAKSAASISRLPSGRGRAQRAQARPQILVAAHDRAAALPDEVLDLEVHDRALVVGAQPEVATVPDDQLAARERVADLGRGAAVHVGAVENGDHAVRPIDRGPIGRADLAIERAPGQNPLASRWHTLDRIDLLRFAVCPGVDDLVAEAAHERDEHRLVEVAPGFREAERTGQVDARRGAHEARG